MHLTEEALLCLSAALELPPPAAHSNQLQRGEQVKSSSTYTTGWTEGKRSLMESKPVFIAVSPVTQSQKMFISPSAHTPISRMMGRLKFEQTVKLEEHSYF